MMTETKLREKSLGPAPFASFDDILLEENTINEVSLHLSRPFTPRIDISQASSSSQQDEIEDNPKHINADIDNDIIDDSDLLGSKLGIGFKEDNALDLRSSTEDLMFEDPDVANKIRGSRSASPTHIKIESELVVINQHRKDSQCSDLSFLPISGRTSRLSSYGSHLSINSNRSDISRSSSPSRLLLETSFCTSHSPQHSPITTNPVPKESMISNDFITNNYENEIISKTNLPKPKEGETDFIFIPLKGPLKPRIVKKDSTKMSIAETVFGNKKSLRRPQAVKKLDENSKDVIRIKLKPDHMYDHIEKPKNIDLGSDLNEIEMLRQEIAPFERKTKKSPVMNNLQVNIDNNNLPGLITNNVSGTRSRKNSFSNLIKNTLVPTTTQIVKRASLSNIFKSVNKKSITTDESNIKNNKSLVNDSDKVIRIRLRTTPSIEDNNIVEQISKQVEEMCHDLNKLEDRSEKIFEHKSNDNKIYDDDNDNDNGIGNNSDNDNDGKYETNSDSTTSQSLKMLNILSETQSNSELKNLMLQDESSFDDEFIFVPTTLPMERSMVVPIVPVCERVHHLEKLASIERPRSSSIIKQQNSFVHNFRPQVPKEWVNFDDMSTNIRNEINSPKEYNLTNDFENCSCECHESEIINGFDCNTIDRDEDEVPLLTDDESN